MSTRIAISILLAICLAASAGAGYLDPNLEKVMTNAGPDDPIRAYVVLAEQVNLEALVDQFDADNLDLERRHEIVINRLRELATDTQRNLINLLDASTDAGEVFSYKPFWITNALAVSATKDFLKKLIENPVVGSLYLDAPIELIEPVGEPVEADAAAGIENGIAVTNAPDLWAMGIDGTGTLACDQDTGADGSHPAFADRWLGLEVDPAQAWFDPVGSETFPTDSGSHGTHTLGTILGDDGEGNQIGMAPGAKWIGAKTIDIPGGNIMTDAVEAFQWAADPDDDPLTFEDVPDVVSNSWGLSQSYYGGCLPDFNTSIDAAEAAGAVVVFAAGNEGSGSGTLRSPGNRITSKLNAFSVGALEQNNSSIADFSSRGPSDCDDSTIKPEISAVGVSVRSSVPGGGYSTMSGTSMATPTVAGAVLLLRDAFPEATAHQIKFALYMSASDLGDEGDDNVFGMGALDVLAAYQFLLLLEEPCTGDIDCDDGLYCNGYETCNISAGTCEFGVDPCAGDELCLEGSDTCQQGEEPEEPGGFCGMQSESGGSAIALTLLLGIAMYGIRRRITKR